MARRLGHLYDKLRMDEGQWNPHEVEELKQKIAEERHYRGVNVEVTDGQAIKAYRNRQRRIKRDGSHDES